MNEKDELIESVFFNIFISYIRMIDEKGDSENMSQIMYSLILLLENVVKEEHLESLHGAVDNIVEQADSLQTEEEIVPATVKNEIAKFEEFLDNMIETIEEKGKKPIMSMDDIYKSIGWEQ